MKNKINISFFLAIILIFLIKPARAALTSVNMILPSPTTMSDGRGYYKASGNAAAVTYNFDISFTNAGVVGAGDYTDFQLTIPTDGVDIIINYNPVTTAVTYNVAGIALCIVTPPGNWANGTIRFNVRFYWAVTATNNGNNNIVAQIIAGGITLQDTVPQVYGITSDIRVYNFRQGTPADDGYISPTHAGFDVQGTIIYDLPGYNLETAADIVADNDIANVNIGFVRTTLGTNFLTLNDAAANAAFTVTVNPNAITEIIANGHYWEAQIAFNGGGVPEDSTNTLPLECNQIQVTNVEFIGGVGRGPTHAAPDNIADYYRAYEQPGTLVRVTAQNQVDAGSGQAMHGDTTFIIEYTDGVNPGNFNVVITNGNTVGTAAVEYNNATGFLNIWTTNETTTTWTYSVTAVANIMQGNDYISAVTEQIIWDRNDPPPGILVPPGALRPVPSITGTRVLQTAVSATVFWAPLAYGSGTANGDLYEYKIYYRRTGDTNWLLWNGANDISLRFPNLANQITGGEKYTILTNLDLYTEYEYYLSAIDIFGNEILAANTAPLPSTAPGTFRTQPFSIGVTLSDGITTHDDSFIDLTPTVRPLRSSNIRVRMTIVAGNEVPDAVRIWYAAGNINTAPDIVNNATNAANSAAFPANSLFSADAQQLDANTWVAFISTDSGLLVGGNSIRFVIETVRDNVSAFTDTIIEQSPNEDPNNNEYTFYIEQEPVFTPWPVRILNNVITDRNPVAYPAYYLTADAYVTIKVYDIKGRPVATILDKALRRGGQNIKENGWRGRNKAGKKLGIGLYYVQIKAKRASDGKIILNKFKKVVMRR